VSGVAELSGERSLGGCGREMLAVGRNFEGQVTAFGGGVMGISPEAAGCAPGPTFSPVWLRSLCGGTSLRAATISRRTKDDKVEAIQIFLQTSLLVMVVSFFQHAFLFWNFNQFVASDVSEVFVARAMCWGRTSRVFAWRAHGCCGWNCLVKGSCLFAVCPQDVAGLG
jgi:hypothetical protein